MLESKKSLSLIEIIREKIKAAGGQISFAEFMGLALYHPELGYYINSKTKFGEKGDFVTAPELSPLFAKSIANAVIPIFQQGLTDFLEIGGGTGQFAADFLRACAEKDYLPDHYYIYEISPSLRLLQKETLEKIAPHLLARVHWLDSLDININGVIFANEVIDALPVHCFSIQENTIKEKAVAMTNTGLQWELREPYSELKHKINSLQKKYELNNYDSEISLEVELWLDKIAKTLNKGIILLFDYGYTGKEYFHPDRNNGTLLCYSQHTFHDNPFIHVGEQDITAHVNFTQIAEIASELGFSVSGFATQAGFLLDADLLNLLINDSSADAIKEKQAIKRLLFPAEMGEAIKVMALSKNFTETLPAFLYQDRRQDL